MTVDAPSALGIRALPTVLLVDLDDTIVTFEQHSAPAWRHVCSATAPKCGTHASVLFDEVQRVSDAYWADPERHRVGRLSLDKTRRQLVRQAFQNLRLDIAHADAMTDAFTTLKEGSIGLFPGAKAALAALSASCRLALVTNGEAHKQRAKIERFGLAPFFERIFIEEEVGVGKPDPRVFRCALDAMKIGASDCWMVGDNLAWDVAAPQTLGIYAVWNDWRGTGLPAATNVRPDRIIRGISELVPPTAMPAP